MRVFKFYAPLQVEKIWTKVKYLEAKPLSTANIVTDPRTRTLVDELGGIPLALAATGKYLRQVPITISEYLTLYKEKYLQLQSQSPQAPEYENKLHTNFEIAFFKASSQSFAAFSVLNQWAYLDSHGTRFCTS